MWRKSPQGFSVRLFLPTGEPEGLRIVEKSNWIGQGLMFPRAQYAQVRKRPELQRPGVYILWGFDEDEQLPRVYIGEGDEVRLRLDQHARDKDFWTHAIVFTSKDTTLNKAHIRYLEARLITLAQKAKRSELENSFTPQLPSLSEPDIADAEAFLEDMLLLLPILGVNFFEHPKGRVSRSHMLYIRSKGIEARGFYGSEGFVVMEGSQAVQHEAPSIHSYLSKLRRFLVENGVLQIEGDAYRFTQDYTFSSPSTAAGVVLGRAANGRTEWKNSQGRTLKEIQQAEIA